MQWDNLGLYNAKAIKNARKKAIKARQKAKRIALVIEARKALSPGEVKAFIKARRNKPIQYAPLPDYRPGLPAKVFYQTREWKELRYQAFARHGNKCQCCGAVNQILHVDHIKARSKSPEIELELDNLQILCEPCNIGKSNKDATDWR